MTGTETTALEVVTGALSGVEGPVRTSFFKAMSDLLGGLTAIPAAKFKQWAQGIEDTTAARSAIANVIAKAAAEDGKTDPMVMQAAAEIYLPTTLRKAKSRIAVAQRAAEHIAYAAEGPGEAAPPEDDWMNAFMRFAEDASSEKLQDLFGRVLAGQIVRPGSFGLSTLRAISELDQEIASDFSIVWAKSVGEAIDYSPEFQRGDGFSRWKRLAEAGLMAESSITQYLPPFSPVLNGNALWSPMASEDTHILIEFTERCQAQWQHIMFTRVGREIGGILARPDYEANMREAGLKLAQPGVANIKIASVGKPVVVLFAADPTP
jgi:hypothetical protein